MTHEQMGIKEANMGARSYCVCPDCSATCYIMFGVAEGLTKILFYARCMKCHVNGIPATIRITVVVPRKVLETAIMDGLPVKKVA